MVDEKADVIVVGAGFAGLTAARDLGAAGYPVLVLEGRDRLGGRTWYRPFAGRELEVEMGGTWIDPAEQPSVAAELERYGLELEQSPEYESYRWPQRGELRSGPMPVPAAQLIDLERALFAFIEAARRIDFGSPLDGQDCGDLDVPFRQVLDRLRLPPETDDFLSAWCGFVFGCTPEEVSALQLAHWLAGFDCSAWGLYASLTDKIAGGTSRLARALADDAGAEVRLSTPVAAIAQSEEGVTVTTRGGAEHRAAAAVLAVPVNLWGEIELAPALAGAKAELAARGQDGHAVKAWALVDRHPPMVGVSWDSPLHWLSTEYQTAEGSLLVGFGSSPERLDLGSAEAVAAAVRAYLPDAELLACDGHDWNQDEFSRGTWMAFPPGLLSRHHSELQAPVGRLAFATADIATEWAGWIDGAIERGGAAARQVAEILAPDFAATQTQNERTVR
ncbi:MAG: FAD-dependent oxidoreductase [Actinobacteria bacterium]|nr:FAD-dependent oxidoreductase [Actinomycetota bacterium]